MKKLTLILSLMIGLMSGMFAFAGGYDAGVYQQQGGQILQQGSASTMQVLAIRDVKMEVQGNQNGQMQTYAITAAGAVLGGIAGNSVGNGNGRQAAVVLGGLLGGLGGNMAADMMSGPKTVNGQELTLLDPATRQVVVIVQGGNEHFAEGQEVLVVRMGSTVRITAAPRYVASR